MCAASLHFVKIRGIKTNLPFLENVLRHPEFLAGDAKTSFIEVCGLIRGGKEVGRFLLVGKRAPVRAGQVVGERVFLSKLYMCCLFMLACKSLWTSAIEQL